MGEAAESDNDEKQNLWHRLRARRSTRWAMDIAIVVVIVLAISAFQSRHLIDGGEPLPPAQLEGLDGEVLDLEELDARRTVIYFWAPWCGVCDLQNGAVSGLYDGAGDDLDVIGVALGYDERAQVQQYVDDHDIEFPTYLGTPADSQRFEIESFPTVYIVDDEQRVRHGLVGYTTRLGMWARLWI